MTWSVEGTYIEACNCEVACPCIFFSPPTEGECKVIVGWHIDKGRHGDAVLEPHNAALIAYAPGNMKDGKWKVALYLDERGNDKQRAALQGIFSGADGGHLANLGPLIAQVLGARSARITFDKGANSRFRLEVEGAASTEMQPVEGQGGGTVEIKGTPVCSFSRSADDRLARIAPQNQRSRYHVRHRRAKRLLRSVCIPGLICKLPAPSHD